MDLFGVIYPPGSKFNYSGGGYSIIQLLIEEITGESFPKYMKKTIFEPLGMRNSGFERTEDIRIRTPKAHSILGTLLPNYHYSELAAAGCYSTASDLAKFSIASMKGSNNEEPGRGILSPETIELMFTKVMSIQNNEEISLGVGLGYFLNFPKELPGIKVVQHDGGNTGWSLEMSFIPTIGAGLIVLTNSESGYKIIEALTAKWLIKLREELNVK